MRPAKPHLFDVALPAGRTVPQHRGKGIARLMQRQRVKPVPDRGTQMVVVKTGPVLDQQPQQRHLDAQRFDGVKHPHHLDRGLVMAKPLGKGPRRRAARIGLIMPVHQRHPALGRMFAFQQANPVNHPGQRAHRIGPARIADQENPVTGPIAAGKPAIGAANQAVQTMALDDRPTLPPPLPLQARLVIHIASCLRPALGQQPVNQPDIGFLTSGQAGKCPIQQNDMIHLPPLPPYGGCGYRGGGGMAAPPMAQAVDNRQMHSPTGQASRFNQTGPDSSI